MKFSYVFEAPVDDLKFFAGELRLSAEYVNPFRFVTVNEHVEISVGCILVCRRQKQNYRDNNSDDVDDDDDFEDDDDRRVLLV